LRQIVPCPGRAARDPSIEVTVSEFLTGNTEMAQRLRAFDWHAHPLGPPLGWPAALRTAVRVMLTTHHPVFIFWGVSAFCFYNDAYRASLGPEKHPSMLGARGDRAWTEIWPLIGPQVAQVMAGGEATSPENQGMEIWREGGLARMYWTCSYSPLDDDSAPGGVGGVLVLCQDTTDQVLDAQRSRGAELREIIDAMVAFVGVLTREGVLVEANAPPLEISGLNRADVLGRLFWECAWWTHDPAVQTRLEKAFDRALGGEIVRYEETIRASGNTRRVIDLMLHPVSRGGEVRYVVPSAVDITERKRAEAQARAQQTLLIQVIASMTEGVSIVTLDGELLLMNRAGAELLGFKDEQDYRRRLPYFTETFTLFDTEGRELAVDEWPFPRVLRGEAVRSQVFEVVRRDTGLRIWLSYNGGLVDDEDGKPSWALNTYRDVTRERQAQMAMETREERFRLMADEVPTAIWVNDMHGRIESVNAPFRAIFGTSPQALQSEGWSAVLHPEDRDRFVAALTAACDDCAPFRARARVRHANGQWRQIDATATPRLNDEGVFLGHVGMTPDVTELVESQRALEEVDRRKDEFLATLGHELRNPLAPIRTAAQVLASARLGKKELSWAQAVISRQADHMARLLDDLLNVARINRGTLELDRASASVASVIEAAIEIARPGIDAKAHQLQVEIEPGLPPLHVDRLRLAQVLSNLLTNAAKYTARGGRISMSAQAGSDGAVRIAVSDSGIGLASEALLPIFNMYTQVNESRSEADGGMGVGLALAKSLVELHGGRIEAFSGGLGQGSEFVIILPASLAPTAGLDAAAVPTPAPALEDNRTVLVADDNGDAATTLAMWLRMNGHRVHVASSGVQALALARECAPEVAILDIGLPDIDGYELARRLRAEPPAGGTPLLIALTGWGQAQDRQRALDAGFDHHMTKPAVLPELDALLRLGRVTTG